MLKAAEYKVVLKYSPVCSCMWSVDAGRVNDHIEY